jgi:hypothetical protein
MQHASNKDKLSPACGSMQIPLGKLQGEICYTDDGDWEPPTEQGETKGGASSEVPPFSLFDSVSLHRSVAGPMVDHQKAIHKMQLADSSIRSATFKAVQSALSRPNDRPTQQRGDTAKESGYDPS